jgi:hypothetical protein
MKKRTMKLLQILLVNLWNKELLQELDKTRNASKLKDEDRVVHNLKTYMAGFEKNNVYKKSSLTFMVGR